MRNKLATQPLFELAHAGRRGCLFPASDVPAKPLDELIPAAHLSANAPSLPELAEPDVIRHFVNLSTLNMSVDTHFYPLGSCTMKYNPKRHERAGPPGRLRRPASVSNRARFAGHAADALRAAANAGRDLRTAGRHAATGGGSPGRVDGTPRGGGVLSRSRRNDARAFYSRRAPTAPIPRVPPWPASSACSSR